MGAALDLGRQWVIASVKSFVVVSSASARAAGSRGTGAFGDGAAAAAVAQGKSDAALNRPVSQTYTRGAAHCVDVPADCSHLWAMTRVG